MIHIFLLMQVTRTQTFAQLNHPGEAPDLSSRLVAACSSTPSGDRVALLKREQQLAATVRAKIVPAGAWTSLGCVRALLYIDGAVAHDGPLMVSGTSWVSGSQSAMIEALKQRPADPRAADVLALLALDQAEPQPFKAIVGEIVAAVHGGVTIPRNLRACSEFAFRVADEKDTYACARKALAAGKDSTWHLLRLARLGFRIADTLGSATLFSRGRAQHTTR